MASHCILPSSKTSSLLKPTLLIIGGLDIEKELDARPSLSVPFRQQTGYEAMTQATKSRFLRYSSLSGLPTVCFVPANTPHQMFTAINWFSTPYIALTVIKSSN